MSLSAIVMAMGVLGFVAAARLSSRRRPGSRLSVLLYAAAGAWTVSALRPFVEEPAIMTIVLFGAWAWAAVLGHLLLALPDGRLTTRGQRVAVGMAYAVAFGGQASWALLATPETFLAEGCPECSRSLLSLGGDHELAETLIRVERTAAALVAVFVGLLLLRRWRDDGDLVRRSLMPVLGTGGLATIAFAASVGALAAGLPEAGRALQVVLEAAFVAVPVAFVVSVLRTRWSIASRMARTAPEITRAASPAELSTLLSRAMGDPSLEVVRWEDVDEEHLDDGRTLTPVIVRGEAVAAVFHHPAMGDERELLDVAGATVAAWMEHERLQQESRDSRARLVAAADAERRRIERDLHDGAQQRLTSLLLSVAVERRRADDRVAVSETFLEALEDSVRTVIAEVRALAAGVLPPALADFGLLAALEELADGAALDVRVEAELPARLPRHVEVALYFVAAEALANAQKHAGATRVIVSAGVTDGAAWVGIRDVGRGGAVLRRGGGLQGLEDRVHALDGRLQVESGAGCGTTLTAFVPCAS